MLAANICDVFYSVNYSEICSHDFTVMVIGQFVEGVFSSTCVCNSAQRHTRRRLYLLLM